MTFFAPCVGGSGNDDMAIHRVFTLANKSGANIVPDFERVRNDCGMLYADEFRIIDAHHRNGKIPLFKQVKTDTDPAGYSSNQRSRLIA